MIDRYVGEISMLDSGDVIRVDQAQLETVIPSPGGSVLVSGPGSAGDCYPIPRGQCPGEWCSSPMVTGYCRCTVVF